MTQLDETTSVRTAIEVAVPPERAFEVFTVGIDTWWNRAHHVQDGPLAAVGVDPFVGGRVWEQNEAGDVCVFGRVLGWDPGRRFVFSWLIGPDWAVPALDAPGSTVTVTFTPTESGTHVELVHTELDRHGTDWQDVQHALGAETGWSGGLRAFVAAAQA